jgi:hypothetical protein
MLIQIWHEILTSLQDSVGYGNVCWGITFFLITLTVTFVVCQIIWHGSEV